MKLLQIVTNTGAVFTVGAQLTEDGAPIEKIIYERDSYNKGKQGAFPAYVLFFEDSPNRQIIRESAVDIFVVDPEKEKKKDDAVPELPAGPGGHIDE